MSKTYEEAVAIWFGRWIDEHTARCDPAFWRVTRDYVDWTQPICLDVEGDAGCHYSSYTWEPGRSSINIHFTGTNQRRAVVEVIDATESPEKVPVLMRELFQIGFED
jgi:hypothetical protein